MDKDTPTENTNALPSTTSSLEPQERLKRLRDVSALVARLLRHYWTADDDPATRQAQIEDWIDDLVEFPPEIVDVACRMWRQANKHRPTPYDIRCLAIAENAYRTAELRKILPGPPKCSDRWASCSERWHARGFICEPACREKIPDYRELADDEAFAMFGERGLRSC